MSEQKGKSRYGYMVASASLLVLAILLYFVWPEYRQFLQDAWEILRSGNTKRIETWVGQFGIWGPLLIIFLMILQMFLIVVPSWLLMVISVLAYGPVVGGILSIVAVGMASTVGYGVGVVAGEQLFSRFLGESKEAAMRRETERYGFWAVIVTRLNPLLSNDAISFLGGMLRMGYTRFLLATLAGISPLALAIALFGDKWENMKSGLIVLSILSLIGLGLKIWYDKRHGESTEP